MKHDSSSSVYTVDVGGCTSCSGGKYESLMRLGGTDYFDDFGEQAANVLEFIGIQDGALCVLVGVRIRVCGCGWGCEFMCAHVCIRLANVQGSASCSHGLTTGIFLDFRFHSKGSKDMGLKVRHEGDPISV